MTKFFLDTGPLVALLDRRDSHHAWARETLDAIEPPIHACEPVIAEACFLLRRFDGAQDAVLALLAKGLLVNEFRIDPEVDALRALMRRFVDVPMSLADACLVRMTEMEPDSVVVTLDSDFRIYRRNRRQVVPAIMPD